MTKHPLKVGDRVKSRVSGITPAAYFHYKVEEVHPPGQRPDGIASDLIYSVGNWTYIVSRVNTYGHTSRYYFDERMVEAIDLNVEGGITLAMSPAAALPATTEGSDVE